MKKVYFPLIYFLLPVLISFILTVFPAQKAHAHTTHSSRTATTRSNFTWHTSSTSRRHSRTVSWSHFSNQSRTGFSTGTSFISSRNRLQPTHYRTGTSRQITATNPVESIQTPVHITRRGNSSNSSHVSRRSGPRTIYYVGSTSRITFPGNSGSQPAPEPNSQPMPEPLPDTDPAPKPAPEPSPKPTPDPRPPVTPTVPPQTSEAPSSTCPISEQELLALVNQERINRNLAPLERHTGLTNLARLKSSDMYENSYFAHTSPTYGSPGNMISEAGIIYSIAAENIGRGGNVSAIFSAFMDSGGHRSKIIDSRYTHTGVGIVRTANGTYYITQLFIVSPE